MKGEICMRIVVYASLWDGSEIEYGRYQASSVEEVEQFMRDLDERRFWMVDHTHRSPSHGFRYEVEEEVPVLPLDVSVHLVDLVLFVDVSSSMVAIHFDSLLPECSGFDHQATVGQIHVMEPYHHQYQFHLVLDPSSLGYQEQYDATFDQFQHIADYAEGYLHGQLGGGEVFDQIHQGLERMRIHFTLDE